MVARNHLQASTKSTKKLLQRSVSSASETSEFTSNTPSPTEMLETEEPHHYANPQDLRNDVQVELDKIDGRKKTNLLYEPLPIKENGFHHTSAKNIEDSGSYSPHTSYNDRLYRFLFVVVFILSLGAFILSILTSFGVLNSCGGCVVEASSPSTSQAMTQDKPTENIKIKEMSRNLTLLQDVIIPSLLRQVADLEAKMKNESLHGQPGPQGPPGVPGPAGAGDLSKCQYRTEGTSTFYPQTNPDREAHTSTPKLTASQDSIILGASCTTVGGSEHGLFQESRNGQRYYYCMCAGKAATRVFENRSLQCRIHLWECPMKS